MRELGADTTGTIDAKKQRVRQNTEFFTSPSKDVIARVVYELRKSRVGWAGRARRSLDCRTLVQRPSSFGECTATCNSAGILPTIR